MTIYFVTDTPWPTTDEVLAQAESADVILHGIPETLAGVIPDGTLGHYEVEVTSESVESDPLVGFLERLLAAESMDEVRQAAQSALESLGGA